MAEPSRKVPRAEAKARRRAERALGKTLPATLHCSFCGKSQHAVEKLIAGPRGAFICGACVGLCQAIVTGGAPPAGDTSFHPLERPTPELLDLLPSINFATDANRDFLQDLVDALRAREVSWADIGAALGVSRQAAWERFS